jgi:hypothetical protein
MRRRLIFGVNPTLGISEVFGTTQWVRQLSEVA